MPVVFPILFFYQTHTSCFILVFKSRWELEDIDYSEY